MDTQDKPQKREFGTHVKAALKEMCSRVNVKYEDVDFFDPQWYCSHTWNKKEEISFHDWLVDYWYKTKEARLEMLRFPSSRRKTELKKAADWFIFNYGWKRNDV